MKWLVLVMLIFADLGAFHSVPEPVRIGNKWATIPFCGFVLAAEYHFGNKLNE